MRIHIHVYVLQDYHVFLIRKSQATVDVFDLDTLLGFPSSFEDYIRKGVGPEENMVPTYHRFVVLFLGIVSSDSIASFPLASVIRVPMTSLMLGAAEANYQQYLAIEWRTSIILKYLKVHRHQLFFSILC